MARKRKSTYLDKIYRDVVKLLASDGFFYGVIALAVLQAFWYAFSFQPTIFDEGRHLGNIFIYSNHWSPFLGNQNPAWDHLGEITRDGSYMFYYTMNWPLRLFRLFTDNQTAQIISLRIVCTAFFAVGLILYRKAFREFSKIPNSVLNLIFLFFVITPSVALLPGAVNYDNLAFLLFALILLLSVRAVKSERVSFLTLATILMVGLFMTVVKWSSVALFAPVAIYLCYDLYQKHGSGTFPLLLQSAKELSGRNKILIIVGLAVTIGLFVERPVANVIEYGKPEPACQAVIGRVRCTNFPDYVIYANIAAHKPANFTPENPVSYLLTVWEPKMADTTVNVLEQGKTSELRVMKLLFSLFALIGVIALLVYLRDFLKDKYHRFLLLIVVGYTAFLVMNEYQAYVTYGIPAAIRARYLIPVLPIFMYFVALAFFNLYGKHRKTALASVCLLLLLFTQGGSIITYSLTTPKNLYWQNSRMEIINSDLQRILHPLVKE